MLAASLAGWSYLQSHSSKQRPVAISQLSFATVVRGDLVRDISVEGHVSPMSAPTLYAPSGGVVSLRAHSGQVVSKGTVVATIDSPELRSKLAVETAALASAEVDYRRAEISAIKQRAANDEQLRRAEINLQTSQREYDRTQRAFDMGAYPEITLLRAKDDLEKAEFAMHVATDAQRLDSKVLAFEIESKRLARDKQQLLVSELRRQLDALSIQSPVTGQVGQILAADKASIAAGAALLTTIDLSAFELDIKMPESLARDVSLGLPAEIASGSLKWRGQVASISPTVVQGQVAARLQFIDRIPTGLKANQRLSVRIILDRRPHVLTVENGPWLQEGGGQFAYRVQGGIATRQPVRTGVASIDKVEIVSGLKSGDQIVVSGVEQFANAASVALSR